MRGDRYFERDATVDGSALLSSPTVTKTPRGYLSINRRLGDRLGDSAQTELASQPEGWRPARSAVGMMGCRAARSFPEISGQRGAASRRRHGGGIVADSGGRRQLTLRFGQFVGQPINVPGVPRE